jgi:hypothetical protein
VPPDAALLAVTDSFMAAGLVPRLVQFLGHDCSELQFEAAGALACFAANADGRATYADAVFCAGGAPALVQLIRAGDDDTCEQALWALGSLLYCDDDTLAFRNTVLDADVVPALRARRARADSPAALLRSRAMLVSRLSYGEHPPRSMVVPLTLDVVELLACDDTAVLTTACEAANNLTYMADAELAALAVEALTTAAGARARLLELLSHRALPVVEYAARVVQHICESDPTQVQHLLDAGLLPALATLLAPPPPGAAAQDCSMRESIMDTACMTLCKVLLGTPEQRQAVFEARLMAPVVAVLRSDIAGHVKARAAVALFIVASSGTDAQVYELVAGGVVELLCDAVTPAAPPQLVIAALLNLVTLAKMPEQDGTEPHLARLLAAGGLENAKRVQREHPDDKVKELAAVFLDDAGFGPEPADGDAQL